MKKLTLLGLVGLTLGLVACEEKGNSLNLGEEATGECGLTLDGLDGTTWMYDKLESDGSRSPDEQTRMKFVTQDGKLVAKYTVGSYSDVYDFECRKNKDGDELECFEKPKVKDWCQALMVVGQECTLEAIQKIDRGVDQAAFDAGSKEAAETVAKFKDGDKWDQFVLNNNNLGNKLQGRVYVKVHEKKCQLRITDNYMTIYNGEMKEDSNPVGTDFFVKSDEEFMFEHCTDSADMIAMKAAEFPATEEDVQPCLPNQCGFAADEEVHYHYIGTDGRELKEGCTASYDVWVDYKSVSKDNAAEMVDFNGKQEARYHFSQKFSEPGAHIAEIVRYTTCEGKKEQVEVACNMVLVQ